MSLLIADAPPVLPPPPLPPPEVAESPGGGPAGSPSPRPSSPVRGSLSAWPCPCCGGMASICVTSIIGVVLYAVTGHGITIGYHRLFTHRSFKANRVLKIALAAAGSMAIEGSLISWVANHRRHHRYSDQPGDPHTPHSGSAPGIKSFIHAHVGWLFNADTTPADRYAADLLADNDLVAISRLFPLFAVASLAIPFGIGYALSGLSPAPSRPWCGPGSSA